MLFPWPSAPLWARTHVARRDYHEINYRADSEAYATTRLEADWRGFQAEARAKRDAKWSETQNAYRDRQRRMIERARRA